MQVGPNPWLVPRNSASVILMAMALLNWLFCSSRSWDKFYLTPQYYVLDSRHRCILRFQRTSSRHNSNLYRSYGALYTPSTAREIVKFHRCVTGRGVLVEVTALGMSSEVSWIIVSSRVNRDECEVTLAQHRYMWSPRERVLYRSRGGGRVVVARLQQRKQQAVLAFDRSAVAPGLAVCLFFV